MRPLIALLAMAAIAMPAAAQRAPEWRTAPEQDVLLRPWAIEPETIRLEADRPVRLRFVNQGQTTHSFSAGAFFRSARLRRRDRDLAEQGRLLLGPGERRTVALVPAAGRYGTGSANPIHWLFGMRGRIVVE